MRVDRLWIINGVVVLSVVALTAIALVLASSQRRSDADIERRFADRTVISATLIEGTVDTALPFMAISAAESLGARQLTPESLRHAAESNDAAGLAVFNRAGKLLGATGSGRRPGLAREAHVRRALAGGHGVSPVVGDADAPGLEASISFEARDGTRRVAVIAYPANLAALYFGAPLARVPRTEGGELLVTDAAGRVVVSGVGGPITGEQAPEWIRRLLRERGQGTVEVGGELQHYVVRDLKGTPWKLVAAAPERRLFATVRGFGRIVPWIMFAGLMVAAALGVLMLTRIFRTAQRLDRMNRELADRNREAERATRAKSEFLANMSHELRTPLNGIIGFSELLHDGKAGPVSRRQREYLGDVLRSAEHLLELINDLLDITKVEAGKLEFHPEEHDPTEVAHQVVATLGSVAARKRLEVKVEASPGIGRVVLDRGKLRQVFYNYLSNAIKFTLEGGRIAVRVESEGADRIRVTVDDTGIGIAAGDLPRLFVEFGQLDAGMAKPQPGTGLGLALTKRIVEAQGGQVGVESEPGRGSSFWAVLPRVHKVAAAEGPESAGAEIGDPGLARAA